MSVTTRSPWRAETTLVSLILGLDPARQRLSADAFYLPPAPLPAGMPGDLIAAEPAAVSLLPGWPLPATDAWRVMYRSTSATGGPIAVTGTLMVPQAPWRRGRRPLISYAVGGHGLGPQCTPSLQFQKGTQFELAVVTAHLAQGWAVVATDYERTPAPTFLNARASGQAVLDAARVARRVPGTGLPGDGPVGISGYGQGGLAAAAAAELQPGYAPDVELRGVAAGAAVADLGDALRSVDGEARFGLVPLALAGLRAAYPELPLDGFTPAGQAAVRAAGSQCLPDAVDRWAFRSARELTADGTTIAGFLDAHPAWRARVDEQRIGGVPPAAPVLLYHGTHEPWPEAASPRRVAADWRDAGADVVVADHPVVEHGGALVEAVPRVRHWLAARLAEAL